MADQLCIKALKAEPAPDPLLHALGEPNYEQSVYKANCTHSQPALYLVSSPHSVFPSNFPEGAWWGGSGDETTLELLKKQNQEINFMSLS